MQECKIMYFKYDDILKTSFVFYEDGSIKEKKGRPEPILNKICYGYGTTMKQRQSFIRWRFTYKQKIPLLVDFKREILFFPLFGLRYDEAIWIQYRFVKKVRPKDSNVCIYFTNGETLIAPLHYRSVQQQVRRCKEIIRVLSQL